MMFEEESQNLKKGFAVRWRLEPKNAEDAEKTKREADRTRKTNCLLH
jgi:hypothetical protein